MVSFLMFILRYMQVTLLCLYMPIFSQNVKCLGWNPDKFLHSFRHNHAENLPISHTSKDHVTSVRPDLPLVKFQYDSLKPTHY